MEKDHRTVKENLRDYYDSSAISYHQMNYKYLRQYSPLMFRQYYIESMIERQEIPKWANVLDVGCGPGELTLNLRKKGYNVWSVDISQHMVDMTTELVMENGFNDIDKISAGDIEHLTFDDCFFDVVIAAGVIEYQTQDEKALTEMNRVIMKGGYLIINVTSRYSYIRILNYFYRWLKRNKTTKATLNLIKDRFLKRGEITDFPERRTHSPMMFDKKLSKFGFEKVDSNYFHFSLFPVPLNSLFKSICDPISFRMERLTQTRLGCIGGGYLTISKKR